MQTLMQKAKPLQKAKPKQMRMLSLSLQISTSGLMPFQNDLRPLFYPANEALLESH